MVDGCCDSKVKNLIKSLGGLFRYIEGSPNDRGVSFRQAISKARGNIIGIFPSDNEYSINDFTKLISGLINSNYDLVIGNRNHSTFGTKNLKINRSFISYFGGIVASVLFLLRTNIFCSDILLSLIHI